MSDPTILEFPFDSGAYETSDARWVPDGALAVAENVRLDLDGRLGVRPGYTALGATTYSANSAVFYDLANYDGRLVALGDQVALSRPTDLFEYVPLGAALWRATSGADVNSISGPRLPRATDARMIGRIPDLDADVTRTCVAASSGGKIVSVAQLNGTARIHLFDPATDQTLVLVTQPLFNSRACAAGSNVWVVGQLVSNAIVGFRINPATEEAFTQVTLVAAATVAAPLVDIAVAQTGASDFTIAYTTGANALAVRCNSSGTVQSSWTHAVDTIDALAVCGNAGGTRITVLWHDAVSKAYELQTRTQTGVAVVGPTSVFSGITETVIPRCGIWQEGTQICIIGGRTVTTGGVQTDDIQADVVTNEDTHAVAGVQVYADAVCTAAPVGLTSGGRTDFYYGAVDRLADLAGLGTMQLVQQNPRLPQMWVAQGLAGAQALTANAMGSCAKVGTKLYWGTTIKSIAPRQPDEETFGVSGAVIEVELASTARRSIVALANTLTLAGAMPLTYEGRYLVEQGFAERPVCSIAAAGGGGKFSAKYFVATCWEVVDARGNILRSTPSEFQQVDLAPTFDTAITVSTSTPHSLRRHPLLQADAGLSVRVGFYCTVAGGANLFLEKYVTIATSGANLGDPISTTLNAADSQLADNPVLYTQSQTPLAHAGAPSYRFAWPARSRLAVGGLLAPEEHNWSKLLFPTEPVEWAKPGRLGFAARANQAVTAVGAFEASTIVWTAAEISQVFGRGPEHSGTGEFDDPLLVPAPGGCSNPLSLVSTPLGFFYQMQPDKLMLLARGQGGGAGDVQWIGQPIRTTLAAFPVITGAVHVRSQMLVAFSCNNTAGTDGRILIFDLRRQQWFVDNVSAPVSAVSEYQGRLVYLSAGVVFLQDSAAGSGAMPTQRYGSGMMKITKRLGWGHIYGIGILGTVVSACKLEAFIDYDDGVGQQSLGSITFLGTEGAVEEFWSLGQQKTARFSVTFVVSSASSNLVGFRANGWAAKVEGSRGTTRRGSTGQVS